MKYPDDYINKIICGDCLEVMKGIPDGSIDMIITSPPYNVGIDYEIYDDKILFEKYAEFHSLLASEMFRVIRTGGRIAWNIPSFSPTQNLYDIFLGVFKKAGFKQYCEIVWDKKQVCSRTAWGSFCSANSPVIPRKRRIGWLRKRRGISGVRRISYRGVLSGGLM